MSLSSRLKKEAESWRTLQQEQPQRGSAPSLPPQTMELDTSLGKVTFIDPRADLDAIANDSFLWLQMFLGAYEKNPDLFGVLHGVRCIGTLIVKNEKGAYVIRPHIDLNGDAGWRNVQDYERWRDKWLRPQVKEVTELLSKLFQWSPAP